MSAGAAADCRFTARETDPFTKEVYVVTDWELFTKWSHNSFNQKKGVDFEIFVRAVTANQQDYVVLRMELKDRTILTPGPGDARNAITVREGDVLRLTLEDDSVVELPAHKTVWAAPELKRKDNHYIYKLSLDVSYLLDAEATQALVRQNAKLMHMAAVQNGREFFNDRAPLDFKIKKDMRREVKRAVRCLKFTK
jgi:hypothetical protein